MTTRVLVVDSNPDAQNAVVARWLGTGLGESFADEAQRICPDVQVTVTNPYEDTEVAKVADYSGVIFTGSSVPWNVEDLQAAPLAKVMEAAFAAQRPVYGSCNGMQLAAHVLGGSTRAAPAGREDGLACDVSLTEAGQDHPMMAGRAAVYSVGCVHRDEVATLPQKATLLAGNAHSAVQAFAYEEDGISFWGCQYHPEYTAEYLLGYLRGTDRAKAADHLAHNMGTHLADGTRDLEIRNWLNTLTPS